MKKDKLVLLIVIIILSGALVYTNIKYQNELKVIENDNDNVNDNQVICDEKEKVCKQKNAPIKLDVRSAYGDNEAYHPKVLYFENGWNGYKYWMAYSPYPHADDSKENPHIAVSEDLINWTVPEGLKNPLDEVSKIYKKGKVYNSDPHLVYNSDEDLLECWWRFVNDIKDQVIIYRMVSRDGIKWSDKEVVFKKKRSVEDYLSPSIIYEDGEYHLWYVSGGYNFYYRKSKDLKEWTDANKIQLKYNNSNILTWHIDVIHNNGVYEAVLNSFMKGDKRDKMNLYYTSSEDNINWSTPTLILTPSFDSANWDNKGLYRASMLYANDEYYLFYSGISWTGERGVGMISGPDMNQLCYEN